MWAAEFGSPKSCSGASSSSLQTMTTLTRKQGKHQHIDFPQLSQFFHILINSNINRDTLVDMN